MSQKLRVLLVEDEDHLLDAIKLNLELEGYKVHAVKDGKTALKVKYDNGFFHKTYEVTYNPQK